MRYVDGFVLTVPKKKLAVYRRMARRGAVVWKDHGALQYMECVAEDMRAPWGLPFPKMVKPKAGEVILFSFIVYKSRAHRDRVNAKVMKDPRISAGMDPEDMPFDCKRMAYGGFEVMVDA